MTPEEQKSVTPEEQREALDRIGTGTQQPCDGLFVQWLVRAQDSELSALRADAHDAWVRLAHADEGLSALTKDRDSWRETSEAHCRDAVKLTKERDELAAQVEGAWRRCASKVSDICSEFGDDPKACLGILGEWFSDVPLSEYDAKLRAEEMAKAFATAREVAEEHWDGTDKGPVYEICEALESLRQHTLSVANEGGK